MKNVDFKKLFILIGLIVVIVGVVILLMNLGKKDKLTEEETKNIENISVNYYANLSEGYVSPYGGLDILYSKDEVTFKTLETVEILNSAIKYAEEKGLNTIVNNESIKTLENKKEYGSINEYALYNGKGIRSAIKALFGDVKYEDKSATNNYNFLYDYIYDKETDVYLVKRNKVKNQTNKAQGIDYKIISTEAKDGKAITTIAIVYTYTDENNTMYAKDPNGETIIAENVTEFPEDKIDEFTKYEFTLKQTKDKTYVFESIKKIK